MDKRLHCISISLNKKYHHIKKKFTSQKFIVSVPKQSDECTALRMQTLGCVFFFTAQCVKETYSGSSKTLDERLNLQHGKTKEHMDTDDQQI